MTAQAYERLIYEGRELAMCSEPLGPYFDLSGTRYDSIFAERSTALWRRYVGDWEIKEGRLYLVAISATLLNGGIASLATLFPDFPDRVFAHWYTGTLRIPQGRQLEYVHMGFGSTYERDLLLDVKKGVVARERVRQNGAADATPQKATE